MYLLPVERKKASVRKETNAVSGTRAKIVRKNQNTLPPHLPSHPSHEVEVCRRKVSKADLTMVPFSDNRADIIWKVFARDRPVITPECQFYKTETGCKAGNNCLFPHHQVDEQPNKKPKKGNYFHKKRKRRQECGGYCQHCATIGLRLARLGVPGKPDAKSLEIDSKSTVHSVYASLEKYKSNILISEVTTL